MQVILQQDIPTLGHKGDVVSVKNGYGRNFLIPKGMASLATATALKIHEENQKQRQHKEEQLRKDAEEVVRKLSSVKIKIGAKTSSTGKIFGSVNTVQIAEVLVSQGFAIDRKNITLTTEPIKEIGTYEASVKIYRDIKADISFEVYSE